MFSLAFNSVFVQCRSEREEVASFGPHSITFREYRQAYLQVLKQPDVFDSPELRERFLDELINRRLVASEARRMGLDNDAFFRLHIEAYRDKLLRDAHYKEVIVPRIRVDEEELSQIYAFMQERRKLKHLFTETKNEADSLYQLLQQGADWKRLARSVFTDPGMVDNGGDLGWVHWDQMEYDMGMTAFILPVKTWSEPVKSTYGYHIIFVEDYETRLMLSEREMDIRRHKIQTILEQKKGARLAGTYIEKLMADRSIQVRPGVMRLVSERLESMLSREPAPFQAMQELQFTEAELNRIQFDFRDLMNETLAILDGREISAGRFVAMLNYVPYAAVHQGFKTAMDYVLRDVAITEEARMMKLDQEYPFVGQKTNLYEEYRLQMKAMAEIGRSATLTDSVLQEYLQKRSLENLGPEQVSEALRRQIERENRLQSMSAFVMNLKAGYEIRKNTESIHTYYDGLK